MADIANITKNLGKTLKDNSPALLTMFAVGGVLTTTVLAVKGTPRALDLIADAQHKKEQESTDDVVTLTKLEVCKVAWQPYIPAAAVGVGTITAIILSNRLSAKRATAVAAAYSFLERAHHEYRDGVLEEVGPKTEEKIRGKVAEKRLEREPLGDKEIVFAEDEQLFYDMYSGRSFMSTVETVRRAMNDINALINNASYASLNDFYRKIGLSANSAGEEVGFNGDHMLDIAFASVVTQGRAAMSIDYTFPPVANYYRLWN